MSAPPPDPPRPATRGAPDRPRPGLVALVGCVVLVADQATKSLALAALGDGPVDLLGPVRLRLSFNRGAAFGLGGDAGPLLAATAAVLVIALALMARRPATRGLAVAFGLVLGGAVGNLVDRLVRGHGGAVVDFIDLRWWPVFNVADATITCGCLLIVVATGRDRSAPPRRRRAATPPARR